MCLLASLPGEWRKADELLLDERPNPEESSTSVGESSYMCMFLGFLYYL